MVRPSPGSLVRHSSSVRVVARVASAAAVSLYADAPLTAQFVLEDHAVRHSYHHLARIRATLAKAS